MPVASAVLDALPIEGGVPDQKIKSAERRRLRLISSGIGDKITSVPVPIPLELYREPCQDEDGNRYTVIVSAPFPNLSMTS